MGVPGVTEIHVAVGVVTDADGCVLIARRHDGAHQGGLWEFPGGKVEPGEPVSAALKRELAEELGIAVRAAEPLIRVPHDYGDKRVYLDVYRVTAYDGAPVGREGQPLCWVAPEHLTDYAFPAANRPITAALALPRTCLVTPEVSDTEVFLAGVDRALVAGVRFVQLRRHDLDATAYGALAEELARRCRRFGALLAINAVAATALELGAAACHLSSRRASECRRGERPVPWSVWLGVSCHNRDEISLALSIHADYLFLSPVRPTPSHPASPPLGWDRFCELVSGVPVPVYALGGVSEADRSQAVRHGAHGLAGISAFWSGGSEPTAEEGR